MANTKDEPAYHIYRPLNFGGGNTVTQLLMKYPKDIVLETRFTIDGVNQPAVTELFDEIPVLDEVHTYADLSWEKLKEEIQGIKAFSSAYVKFKLNGSEDNFVEGKLFNAGFAEFAEHYRSRKAPENIESGPSGSHIWQRRLNAFRELLPKKETAKKPAVGHELRIYRDDFEDKLIHMKDAIDDVRMEIDAIIDSALESEQGRKFPDAIVELTRCKNEYLQSAEAGLDVLNLAWVTTTIKIQPWKEIKFDVGYNKNSLDELFHQTKNALMHFKDVIDGLYEEQDSQFIETNKMLKIADDNDPENLGVLKAMQELNKLAINENQFKGIIVRALPPAKKIAR